MPYDIDLAPEAIEDLAKLPVTLVNAEARLGELAKEPTRLSKPAHFPYWQVQMYQFDLPHDGDQFYITVLFQYGPTSRRSTSSPSRTSGSETEKPEIRIAS